MIRLIFTSAILATMAAAAAPALAQKAYNQSPFLPSREQSMINRVQASVTAKSDATGEYGLFEHDCSKADVSKEYSGGQADSGIESEDGTLKIGALNSLRRPKEQIIVAKDIVNVGGQCRMRR